MDRMRQRSNNLAQSSPDLFYKVEGIFFKKIQKRFLGKELSSDRIAVAFEDAGRWSLRFPYGPENAPVTRALIVASGFLTVAIGARGKSRQLGVSFQDLSKNPRVWKIVASALAFQSTPELLFGLYLLYYFRLFERQIGSNKFSVFILFTGAVSSALEVVALMLLKGSKFNVLASGPYSLIFALFVPFYFDVPITSRFRIFGVNLSDKSFIYLAGLQVQYIFSDL
ncbi:Rhomboid-like protein 20 [Carex littledalei]|uniref:Rhomboid-like protein 20 n=1 Tax=Carex littledalei TaxID=544730 RepID=A0A833VS15_9POAL|nr:Rhomboid-like protein 20 [Carex littledalei]